MQHCFSFRFAAMLQRAKKVGSDSLRLVDFAIGLENSVPQLPRGGGLPYETDGDACRKF